MKLILFIIMYYIIAVVAKNSYIVTVPKLIRPGTPADISITSVKSGTGPVEFTVWLQDKDNQTLTTVNQSFTPVDPTPDVVNLKIPSKLESTRDYKIRVKATGGIVFDKTATRIRVSEKTASIFIQTDRPIYKPGDLVQFRVFGTNHKLKILDDSIDVIIEDPKRNRLKQFLGVKPVFGVFAESYQLSSLTTYGEWSIKVEQGGEKNTKFFSVERYVSPTFEVSVDVPKLQLKTDQFFQATITAMYTFGKPVEGDVEMIIKRPWDRDTKNTIEKKFKIKGKATIKVLMSEIQPRFRSYIEVFAKVTETVTGIDANDTSRVTIYETPEKLTFSSSLPSEFKPGLKYRIMLRVNQHDDSPIKPPLGLVNITVKYSFPSRESTEQTQEVSYGDQVLPVLPSSRRFPPPRPAKSETLWTRVVQIPESGIIVIEATYPSKAESGSIRATYRKASADWFVTRAQSPSRNYIQVSVVNDTKAMTGKPLLLMIDTTEKISSCTYKIFSKGSLLSQGSFIMGHSVQKIQQISIITLMAPQAQLLVFYTRKDGEIVADALQLPIEEMFENKVTLQFNKKRVQPAESVNLELTADPGSLVNVLAVDKSVLLMRTGNDISKQDVLTELKQYYDIMPRFRRWDSWWPRPVGGRDAYSIFNGAGVFVLTDAVLFQYIDPDSGHWSLLSAGSLQSKTVERDGSFGGGAGGGVLASPVRTRKNFPETWLWLNETTSNNGKAIISATAPDTITEWITSAFALNPYTGLGIASESAKLTTFQNFFMRFELPFSAIRGEIIILQITVFNFLQVDLQVVVMLNQSEKFSFADANGNPFNTGSNEWTKSLKVNKDSVNSVFFPIIPTTLGKILIGATARSTQAADAIERELLVEAEGITQSYNIPLLVDLRQANAFNNTIKLTFPPNLVKDSEFIKIQVIGDIMGPTLSGLENLLQMSSGCGEQNMIRFVPNVYVSAYLKSTNRLTDSIKMKVTAFLEEGYQRELSFVHDDGSFSAFGDNDKSGSTWLTAFVVKSFAQAVEFTFIDINVMTRAITWLLGQQLPTGEFQEPGIVLHKEMQGGSTSSKKSLAAFVLIALQEARANSQVDSQINKQVNTAITQATQYIAEGAPASLSNIFELAIVCYALALVSHPTHENILATLETKTVIKDGKYWVLPMAESDIIQPWKSWTPPNTSVRALDIETTSYVLLTYNIRNDTNNGINVLKWLGRQRNTNGGFISTHDTVIALQALSGLGEKVYVSNFQVSVNTKGETWPGKTFNVYTTNALVLQVEDVPNSVRTVSLSANGNGLCLMEAAVYFNVLQELREPAFKLTPTVLNDSIKGFRLNVCFSLTRGQKSTMGYLEISIPTGMEADLESLDTSRAGGLFKKAEKAYRQINLYFDFITTNEICIALNINRASMVARHKPVSIRLSEYYEPSNEVIQFYQSNALANASIIEVCGLENCVEVKRK